MKRAFDVAETFATPSFLPGPLPAGRWRLSLAVASIRKGMASPYHVEIRFSTLTDMDTLADAPVRAGPGWYRGDLHTHTGDSDGYCLNPAGRPAPCPLFLTLQAARDHGLDFIAVTDHNARSQYAAMESVAGYFDTLLLIPGREITTDQGHFNLIGATRNVDYRIGAPLGRTMNDVLHDAAATHGFVSINHPEIPTGEDCLGCGWSAPGADFDSVNGIEVANGGVAADRHGFPEGLGSGLGFWETQLNLGRHITGVGGSDNHDAIGDPKTSPVGAQSPVGIPATVVYAPNLSQRAILDGLVAGRVFVDLENIQGRILDIGAVSSGTKAVMGQTLSVKSGSRVAVRVHVVNAAGAALELVIDGRPYPGRKAVTQNDQTIDFDLKGGSVRRWFRVDARNASGSRIMISNPVYITADQTAPSKN